MSAHSRRFRSGQTDRDFHPKSVIAHRPGRIDIDDELGGE